MICAFNFSEIYTQIWRSSNLKDCLMWHVPVTATEKDLRRFGTSVRRERMQWSMTQERLAELNSMHLRTIQKIESRSVDALITMTQGTKK